MSKNTVSEWERGRAMKGPADLVTRLARALNVPIGWLYGLNGQPGAPQPAMIITDNPNQQIADVQRQDADRRVEEAKRIRVARANVQLRIAELCDGDVEAEARHMRIIDRALQHASAGGIYGPADQVRLIESIGAGIIQDLEDRRRRSEP